MGRVPRGHLSAGPEAEQFVSITQISIDHLPFVGDNAFPLWEQSAEQRKECGRVLVIALSLGKGFVTPFALAKRSVSVDPFEETIKNCSALATRQDAPIQT